MADQKYNWGIAGHGRQLAVLEHDIAAGNLPHAYLFAGAGHIGKYSLARRLAKVLQCENNGCDDCGVCLNIEKGYHSDTLEIVDDGETIKIETMRGILAKLATTTPGKYKIFLVQNIERMTPEAANALLKTLEEPGSAVLFLFTTSQLEDVLPTILSRLRVLKFSALTPTEIVNHLKEKHPRESAEKIQAVTDLAFGLPGRAIAFLEDEKLFDQTRALFERVGKILKNGNIVEKFALVDEVTKDEKLLGEFFDIFLLALRYTMLEEAERGDRPQKLQQTISALQQAQDAVRLQKRNVNARLLFEHLMLQT